MQVESLNDESPVILEAEKRVTRLIEFTLFHNPTEEWRRFTLPASTSARCATPWRAPVSILTGCTTTRSIGQKTDGGLRLKYKLDF